MDVSRLEAVLRVFGALDPGKLPLHHIQVFLLVAREGSCTNHRQEPLGLLELCRDPAEGRRHLVRLTAKGKAIVKAIEAVK